MQENSRTFVIIGKKPVCDNIFCGAVKEPTPAVFGLNHYRGTYRRSMTVLSVTSSNDSSCSESWPPNGIPLPDNIQKPDCRKPGYGHKRHVLDNIRLGECRRHIHFGRVEALRLYFHTSLQLIVRICIFVLVVRRSWIFPFNPDAMLRTLPNHASTFWCQTSENSRSQVTGNYITYYITH